MPTEPQSVFDILTERRNQGVSRDPAENELDSGAPVSAALVSELMDLFPDRSPSIDDSDRLIWMRAGAVEVVKHLQRKLALQLGGSLEDSK